MRILIFGGDGMLGHELVRAWRERHALSATFRSEAGAAPAGVRAIRGIDVRRPDDAVQALALSRPEAVVNAVGIVKQRPVAQDAIPSLEVNALFPHRLAQACRAAGARLVHLSTDCVFSGERGRYVESDPPDPHDLYGRTKLLGEVQEPGALTLRTSIIGLELHRRTSLIEWWLSQRGQIRGYRRAIYSGLTTMEMARAIEHLLLREPGLSGLFHLASAPISKHDLLEGLGRRLGRTDVTLTPDDAFACDRSLDPAALWARTTYRVPPWNAMLDELAAAITERERWP